MAIPVLVVDAAEQFASLIRQTLEETGRYQVTLASSAQDALEIARATGIQLAIVDFELPDLPGPELIRELRGVKEELAVIAIPLSGDGGDPELTDLEVDGVLSKPFYLPDLPQIVAKALGLSDEIAAQAVKRPGPIQSGGPAETSPPPPWLVDVDRAAQYLTRLSLESAATAALLTRGRRLWAYAGELSREQVQELIGMIADTWASEGARGAVTRFIQLSESTDDFMLYATKVAGDIVLSLVFEADTPFGTIRRQAQGLAKTLLQVDPTELPERPREGPRAEGETELAVTEIEVPIPGDWVTEGPSEGAERSFLAALGDVELPSPDPEPGDGGVPGATLQAVTETLSIPTDWIPEKARPSSQMPFLSDEEVAVVVTEGDQEAVPILDAEYDLPFTAVLVPRFPEHVLGEKLAQDLNIWTRRLCVAWDWRAEKIVVEPAYLALTVSLSPEVAPARAVHQLRQDLSKRVIDNYPALAADLPSGRFWVRSYLLVAGETPDDERIQAFIDSTRRAQGLSG